jgi:hypothetical protein
MKKHTLIQFCLLFISIYSYSQTDQATLINRIELSANDNNFKSFKIFSIAEKGVLNMSSKKMGKKEINWSFTQLNKNLKSINDVNVVLSKSDEFMGHFITKTHFHVFFRYGFFGKYKIVTINLSNFKLIKSEGKLFDFFTMENIVVLGENLMIDTKIRRKPYLSIINWKTGKSKQIPIEVDGAKTKRIFFQNLQVMKDESEVFVFIAAKVNKKRNTYALRINKKGEKTDQFCVTDKYEKVISNISVSKISEEECIYTGTYSETNAVFATGVFIGKSNGSKTKFLKFHDFKSLDNFFGFLPDNVLSVLEKKIKKKEKKGKELRLSYSVASHDIIKNNNDYIFLGEAYFPTY